MYTIQKRRQYKKFMILGGAFIALLIMMLFFKKPMIYLLACITIGSIVYVRYIIRLPFKIEPYLFVSIIISLGYGIGPTIIFVIISMIIPKMLAGGEFDGSSWVYLFLFVMMNVVAIALSSMNIVTLGIILSIADLIILLILGTTMRPDKIINGVVIVGINILLFYRFGDIFLTLISSIH